MAAHGTLRTHGELGRVRSQQKGVVRTNCVDCLDRTNVVQALLGRRTLESLLSDLLRMEAGGTLPPAFPQVLPPVLPPVCVLLSCAVGAALSAGYPRTRTPPESCHNRRMILWRNPVPRAPPAPSGAMKLW